MSEAQSAGRENNVCPVASTGVFSCISRLLLSHDRSLNDILDAILVEAMKAVEADRAFIALADFEHGELAVRFTAGEGWNEQNTALRLKVSQKTGKGITSHVAATGRPYRTGDVTTDPYYISHFDDVRSEVAVPVVNAHGRVEGVINMESARPDAFSEQHEEFLLAVANLVALRILADQQEKRQAALVSLGRELARFSRSADVFRKVMDLVASAISFQDCSIFLLNPEENVLVLEASRGRLGEQVHQARYRVGEGITGWVAQNGKPVRTRDPRNDPRWRGLHEELAPETVGGLIAVPIMGYDRVLGVFRVLRRRSEYAWVPNDFTQDDEDFIVATASILGAVLDSFELVKRVIAAERMAAWGEMSARSAHMIGNRVFAIKGDLNELRHLSRQECSAEKLAPVIESLEKGIFRLEEILAEFREFVVATKLNTNPVSLNELLEEAVRESFPRNSSVRLELDLHPDLPLVEADTSKLRRCFSELVENSINFQQEGGVLRVSTEPVDSEQDRIRIVFEDRGPGIPEENKKLIFRPFFSTRSKGMGLGLSIVKGIIDAHRGTIRETGEEGEGARFEIILPAITDTPDAAETKAERSDQTGD